MSYTPTPMPCWACSVPFTPATEYEMRRALCLQCVNEKQAGDTPAV